MRIHTFFRSNWKKPWNSIESLLLHSVKLLFNLRPVIFSCSRWLIILHSPRAQDIWMKMAPCLCTSNSLIIGGRILPSFIEGILIKDNKSLVFVICFILLSWDQYGTVCYSHDLCLEKVFLLALEFRICVDLFLQASSKYVLYFPCLYYMLWGDEGKFHPFFLEIAGDPES